MIEQQLIDAETDTPIAGTADKLRKFTFYLILNTDVTYKWKLADDRTLCHLTDTAPQLTKCLLLACIWGLQLQPHFCDFVSYAPLWFAMPLVEDVVESLKYCDTYTILATAEQILHAIYVSIARSDYRQMDRAERHALLDKCYDVTLDFHREYFTVDAVKYEKWSKNRRYKHCGFVLRHSLDLILFGCGLIQQRPAFALPSPELNVYQVMSEHQPLGDLNVDGYSEVVDQMLKKLHITHLNQLQHNVMQVDCHAFMYWVEIDITDELTLQRAIGEAAHAFIELVNVNDCFRHEVAGQLKTIAVKPESVAERAAQWTIGEFISKLESLPRTDNDFGLWIDTFIGRGELVLGNQECLEMLEAYTDILTSGNIRQLILYASNVDDSACVDEKLIDICLISFDYLCESDILPLISLALDVQRAAFPVFQTDDFDVTLTGVFNRCQYTEDSKTFLKLLFQNPQLFYDKVFDEAIRSEQQMTHMLRILKATASVARTFVDTNLSRLIEDKSQTADETVQRYIPRFIANLFFANVIEPHVFIAQILYKKYLIPAILAQNLPRIAQLMKVFWAISLKHRFGDLSPPILVMAAQVLQQCRWDLLRYTDELETIVVKTTEFINEVLKKYLPTAGDQGLCVCVRENSFGKANNLLPFSRQSLDFIENPHISSADAILLLSTYGNAEPKAAHFRQVCGAQRFCT